MNIVLLSGSSVGSKTRTAMTYLNQALMNQDDTHHINFIDLKELELVFSDGRNYLFRIDDLVSSTLRTSKAYAQVLKEEEDQYDF